MIIKKSKSLFTRTKETTVMSKRRLKYTSVKLTTKLYNGVFFNHDDLQCPNLIIHLLNIIEDRLSVNNGCINPCRKLSDQVLKLCPGRGILLSLVTAIICEKLQMHIYRSVGMSLYTPVFICMYMH